MNILALCNRGRLNALALLALMLALPVSCSKGGTPGNLQISTTQFGSPARAIVEVWDAGGSNKISDYHSDTRGNTQVPSIDPGRYMLRFRDPAGRSFAAQRMVTIASAASLQMEVELTERGADADPQPAGESGSEAQPDADGSRGGR